MQTYAVAIALILFAAPGGAQAHPFHGIGSGAVAGFAHPLLGIDHVLAMLAVGLWAARLGGRALWVAPAAFAGAMLAGCLLGVAGLSLPATEQWVAGSVLALGLFVALPATPALATGAGMITAFGAFHGFTHAAELPADSLAAAYAAGFLLATMALHAAGLLVGRALRAPLLRALGVPLAVAGGWLLTRLV